MFRRKNRRQTASRRRRTANARRLVSEALEKRELLAVGVPAAELLVNDTTGGFQTSYAESRSVAANPQGEFIVAYSGNGPGDMQGIFARRYDASGAPQGTEVLVNETTSGNQRYAAVAMGNGASVVAWSGKGTGDNDGGVFVRLVDAGGNAQGPETRVNQTTASFQHRPAIDIGPGGEFVVVWSGKGSGSDPDSGIYARRFRGDGVPLSDEFRVNTTTALGQQQPDVAYGLDGFTITWAGNGVGDLNGIFMQRYDASGNVVGVETRVNTTVSGHQVLPSIGIDAANNTVIAWSGTGAGDTRGVFLQRFDSAGNPVGVEQRVNAFTTYDQEDASVAVAPSGRAVVTWTSLYQDGSLRGVYGQEFDASGAKDGDEFPVNETTFLDQKFSSVAMKGDLGFVTTWSGRGDGDSNGMFARVFNRELPNADPVANTDFANANVDTPLVVPSLGVLDNDTDADDPVGVEVTVTSHDSTSDYGAAVAVDPDGGYTYDPTGVPLLQTLELGESVTDSFTYTITDDDGASDSARVWITVSGVNPNIGPTANPDGNLTNEDAAASGNVLGNDTDPDDVVGTEVTVTAFDTTSSLGAAVSVAPDGSYTYDPTGSQAIQALEVGTSASDSFTYTITDDNGESSSTTVAINLEGRNDFPVGNDDTNSTAADTVLSVPSLGVLANDTDVDDVIGTEVTVAGHQTISRHGASVTVNADGSYSYDPTGSAVLQTLELGESLVDTFGYAVTDDVGATDSATVWITVSGVNPNIGPTANIDFNSTNEDTPVSGNVLSNDTDPDDTIGTEVTVTAHDAFSARGAAVTVNPDGSYSYDPTVSATLQGLDENGGDTDTFHYTITDDNGATSTSFVALGVTGINDAPVANDDSLATDKLTPISAGARGLMANDSDADDLILSEVTVTQFDPSPHGAAVNVNPDGSYSYDPRTSSSLQALDEGESTTDTFSYRITDDNGAFAVATVTVAISGVNVGPTANIDSNTTDEDTPVSGNVLSNDTDPDDIIGTEVTVTAHDAFSARGAAVTVNPDGSYTYDPTVSAALQALDEGQPDTDTFHYTITDDNGESSTSFVAVVVNGRDEPTPLMAAGGQSTDGAAELLSRSQLDGIVTAARERFQLAGASAEQMAVLEAVDVRMDDLPTGMLGQAAGTIITIDSSAAGYGWFVDATPGLDEEFVGQTSGDRLHAIAGTAADNRMDLLTAVMHEMGHVLGADHGPEESLMGETLDLGRRHLPALDQIFAELDSTH